MGLAALLLFYGARSVHSDVFHYQCYALAFWQGTHGLSQLPTHQCFFFSQFGLAQTRIGPFHLLPLEYPPLTLSLFSIASLAPLQMYQSAFALIMAGVALLIYWLLLRYGPRGAGLAYAFFLVIGAWATAEGRFDLVPAALTLLCLIAAERKHWTLAYLALAAGVLLKIYPLLLLPALFLAEQRAQGLCPRPSEPLALPSLLSALWQTGRELSQWRWKNLILFVVSSLLVLLWQWRGKLDVVQSGSALLLVFIVTGKVFSPQYLMWIIPLLAYNGSFHHRWFVVLWGSISLLTTAVYPYMYMYIGIMAPGSPLTPAMVAFIGLVTLRNLLMVLATLAFFFNWWNANLRQRDSRLLKDRAMAAMKGSSILLPVQKRVGVK